MVAYPDSTPVPTAEAAAGAQRLRRRSRRVAHGRRGWLVRAVLLGADLTALCTAFVITELLFRPNPSVDHVHPVVEALVFLGTLPLWLVLARLYRLYDQDQERTDHSTADELSGIFHLVTVGSWMVLAATWLSGAGNPDLMKLLVFWFSAIALVSLGRASARAYCRRRPAFLQRTLIVGAGDVGRLIAHKVGNHPEYGLELVGFVDANPREWTVAGDREVKVHGSLEQLPEIVEEQGVERIILAFSNDSHEDVLNLMRSIKHLDVQVDIVPRLFEMLTTSMTLHSVEGVPLLGIVPPRLSRSSQLLKRSMDIVLSALLLLMLAPLFAVVAFLIKRESSGPVFFRQVRMGRHERPFRIFKFRSMYADADQRKHEVAHLNKHARDGGDPRMFKIDDDPRITPVGKFIRRTSIDELPQLINVLRGEMSLVGPRPLILEEDQFVNAWARTRLDLRPGITGLWQVLGRDDIPFQEMIRLDYAYVQTWSLWNDCRLLLKTPARLLASGH